MAYQKQTWGNTSSTPLSATRLNKLETQYDSVVADITDATSPVGQALTTTIAAVSSAAMQWQPTPGATAAQNRTSLQAAVDSAIAFGLDLLLPEGTYSVADRVNVTAAVRIFGVGRTRTVIRQTLKAVPTFYASGQDTRFEDFGITGPGLDMTGMSVNVFQESNGIRVENGAHGFQARRMQFTNIYIGILVRPFPNPFTGVNTPVRTARFVVDDIVASGVWSALHGGPFDDPMVNNIRGSYTRATSSNTDASGPPHLVYINTVLPADGVYTDGYYSRGGTFTNLMAWDGPDFIGGAFSFKHMRGATIDAVTARNTRGVLELLNLVDCALGVVTSTDDKYPATGGDSLRASISFSECERTTVAKASIAFASADHGRAIRFESTSTDCRVDVLDVTDNSTVDRKDGSAFDVYVQGLRNTLGQSTFTNKGQPRYAAVVFASTGSYGRSLDHRVGDGYLYGVRVNASHPKALVDYDPMRNTVARRLSGAAKVSLEVGAFPTVRDRSIGQPVARGYLDEFERGGVVTGLAATDDGKPWLYRDSGTGNPNSWQVMTDRAAYVGGGARALALVDGGSADGTLRTTIAALGSGFGSGLAVRSSDINNYIGLMFSTGPGNGQLDLHKRVAGTRASIAQVAVNGTVADGSVVELVVSGTAVSVKVGGVEVIAPQTVTDFASVTTHGLLAVSDGTGLRWARLEFV